MAFLNNYYQVRLDLFRISQLSRRTDPRGTEDIGTWESIFHAVSSVAVVSNCALIVFVGGYLKDYQEWLPFHAVDSSPSDDAMAAESVQGNKWLLFFFMEHAIFLGRMLIDLVIDDVPKDVRIQMERQDLVVRKLIDDAASDSEESEDENDHPVDHIPNTHISQTDDDVVLFSLKKARGNAVDMSKQESLSPSFESSGKEEGKAVD